MNDRQLQYVITVAEERSFSRAAEKLHISQPSLSQYVRSLEKSLNVDLFDRSVTPLALTPIGEEFVKTAYKILALENDLLKRISDKRGDRLSVLNVGISANLSTEEISLAMAQMRTKYPDLTINTHEFFSVKMDEQLEQGELDLTISPITEDFDRNRFCRSVVSRDRFYLASSRTLLAQIAPELADADSGEVVRLERFAAAPFFTLSPESVHTHAFNVAAERAGFTPNVIMRCRRWKMLVDLVEKGVGMALLTDRFLVDGGVSEDVVLFQLDPPAPDLVSAVSWLREAYQPETAKAFIRCYQRIAAQNRDENGYLKRPYLY